MNKLSIFDQFDLNDCRIKVKSFLNTHKQATFMILFKHKTGDVELTLTETSARNLHDILSRRLKRLDE
jgi:hypothetical protein